MHWDFSPSQVIMSILITVIGGIIMLQIKRYSNKRDRENLEKRKARQRDKRTLEEVKIAITAIELGLENAPGINGSYTKVKNSVKEKMTKDSDILNEPLIED